MNIINRYDVCGSCKKPADFGVYLRDSFFYATDGHRYGVGLCKACAHDMAAAQAAIAATALEDGLTVDEFVNPYIHFDIIPRCDQTVPPVGGNVTP